MLHLHKVLRHLRPLRLGQSMVAVRRLEPKRSDLLRRVSGLQAKPPSAVEIHGADRCGAVGIVKRRAVLRPLFLCAVAQHGGHEQKQQRQKRQRIKQDVDLSLGNRSVRLKLLRRWRRFFSLRHLHRLRRALIEDAVQRKAVACLLVPAGNADVRLRRKETHAEGKQPDQKRRRQSVQPKPLLRKRVERRRKQ